jgi:hypothetical protein
MFLKILKRVRRATEGVRHCEVWGDGSGNDRDPGHKSQDEIREDDRQDSITGAAPAVGKVIVSMRYRRMKIPRLFKR